MIGSFIHIDFGDGEPLYLYNAFSTMTVGSFTNYIVKDGDRLDSLAFKFYGNNKAWDKIAQINNILNPFELQVGSSIIIPF